MDRPTYLEPGVHRSSSLWSKIFHTSFFFFFQDWGLRISQVFPMLGEVGYYTEYFHSLVGYFSEYSHSLIGRNDWEVSEAYAKSWYPKFDGRHFWFVTQLYSQNAWTGWQSGVNDDTYAHRAHWFVCSLMRDYLCVIFCICTQAGRTSSVSHHSAASPSLLIPSASNLSAIASMKSPISITNTTVSVPPNPLASASSPKPALSKSPSPTIIQAQVRIPSPSVPAPVRVPSTTPATVPTPAPAPVPVPVPTPTDEIGVMEDSDSDDDQMEVVPGSEERRGVKRSHDDDDYDNIWWVAVVCVSPRQAGRSWEQRIESIFKCVCATLRGWNGHKRASHKREIQRAEQTLQLASSLSRGWQVVMMIDWSELQLSPVDTQSANKWHSV